jgi:hypothetical protein
VDPKTARSIAQYSHVDQRDRFDEPLIEHVERVASAVPPDARSVAFLHDVLEHTGTPVEELRVNGLTPVEHDALELLTREPSESFELYTLRIAHAEGEAGEIARSVKLADLEDHLGHSWLPLEAPPYSWARRHIEVEQSRRRKRGQAA